MFMSLFARIDNPESEKQYLNYYFEKDIKFTAYVALFAAILPAFLLLVNFPDTGIDTISVLRIVLTGIFILCGVLCLNIKSLNAAEYIVGATALLIILFIYFIQYNNLNLSLELVGIYTCFIFALFIVPPMKLSTQMILSIIFLAFQLAILVQSNEIIGNKQIFQVMVAYIGAVTIGCSFRLMFNHSRRKQYENLQNEIVFKKQLEEALRNVKTLEEIIPICASCKKMRNDEGYWKQVEVYITEHTGSQFSHSYCPECMNKLYPDIEID